MPFRFLPIIACLKVAVLPAVSTDMLKSCLLNFDLLRWTFFSPWAQLYLPSQLNMLQAQQQLLIPVGTTHSSQPLSNIILKYFALHMCEELGLRSMFRKKQFFLNQHLILYYPHALFLVCSSLFWSQLHLILEHNGLGMHLDGWVW